MKITLLKSGRIKKRLLSRFTVFSMRTSTDTFTLPEADRQTYFKLSVEGIPCLLVKTLWSPPQVFHHATSQFDRSARLKGLTSGCPIAYCALSRVEKLS